MQKDIVNTLQERGYPAVQAQVMDCNWYAFIRGRGWVKVSDLFQTNKSEPVPSYLPAVA